MSHPDAIGSMLIQEIPRLRLRANRLCQNDNRAEDLVQDTLLKAWANRGKFRLECKLRPWLFTILRNTFFDSYRVHRREVLDIGDVFAAHVAVPAAQEHVIALQEVVSLIATLSLHQSTALLMVGAEGFSYEEAAAASACSVGTIKTRVRRARATLAAIVDSEGPIKRAAKRPFITADHNRHSESLRHLVRRSPGGAARGAVSGALGTKPGLTSAADERRGEVVARGMPGATAAVLAQSSVGQTLFSQS